MFCSSFILTSKLPPIRPKFGMLPVSIRSIEPQFDPYFPPSTPEYPYNVRIGQEICAIPSDRVK